MLISTTQCRVAVLFDFAVAEGLLSDSMAALFETNRHRGSGRPLSPATPPGMRVRTGRFRKIEPLRAGGSIRLSPQGLRRSTGFRFGFTVF